MNKTFVKYTYEEPELSQLSTPSTPSALSTSSTPSAQTSARTVKKKRRISWIKLCVICGLAFCGLQFSKQFAQYQQIQAEIAQYEQIKQDKLAQQKELEKTKLLLDDPAYIERVAREHLGFVYEGEVLVLPSENSTDDIPEYESDIKDWDIH